MGGSVKRIVKKAAPVISPIGAIKSGVDVVKGQKEKDEQTKEEIAFENNAIEEEERRKKFASQQKASRRKAFQASLNQTQGAASIADSNVLRSKLFGN